MSSSPTASGDPIEPTAITPESGGSSMYGPNLPHSGGTAPLFPLSLLASLNRVFLTDNEQSAQAVTRLPGLVGTTWSRHGQAQSPDVANWTMLAGKEVIILAAHDEDGQTAAKQAVEQLARLMPSPTVRLLSLPMVWQTNIPMSIGDDVVDWLERRAPGVDAGPLRPGTLERRRSPPASRSERNTIRRTVPLSPKSSRLPV